MIRPLDYEYLYTRFDDFFGSEPETTLVKYHHLMTRAKPVLDVGVGQGRNAFFLARQEFEVDAIDTSKVAIDTVADIARTERLPLRTFQRSYDTFFPQCDYYSGILIFGLIHILPWDAIAFLVEMTENWTKSGSLIFVSGWNTSDPSFSVCERDWKRIGDNSFEGDSGQIKTFLEEGEILKIFRQFEVVHHWEGMGPEHCHGDGPLERHSQVEAVFRR